VLIIHKDKQARTMLESMARVRHEVESARDLITGLKHMARMRPSVIVVGHDSHKQEGLRLLRYMRENVLKTPVVVVFASGAGSSQPALMKYGARAFLEYPVDDDRLERALAAALQAGSTSTAPPPLTAEELAGNLSMMENKLNKHMKCFAGRNQVFLQTFIGSGARPRIALKCGLRAEYGLNKDVYFEFIRDTCCGDPSRCEAVQRFNAERESA